MTTAQVVETSVTNNSLSKDYPYPDDHAKQMRVDLIVTRIDFFCLAAPLYTCTIKFPYMFMYMYNTTFLALCVGIISKYTL